MAEMSLEEAMYDRLIKCKTCDKEFISHNGFQIYCNECGKRRMYINHKKNLKRERRIKRIWQRNHPQKNVNSPEKQARQKVMNKVKWAVECGKLEKPPYCYCCGEKRKLQAHHRDYSKPLEIIWLCPACHKFLHTQIDLCNAEWMRRLDINKFIDIMREQWQVRDMVHSSITDEKRRDRMIKILAQALITHLTK